MKKILALVAFVAAVSLALVGCLKDRCESTATFKIWKPIVKTTEEIRQEIAASAPRALRKPGQMYLLGKWLFIGEQGEGIHVIDNSNPDQPIKKSFIALPGAVDMAVKDGFLYADNYVDLVVIDIKDPEKPALARRVENVFPFSTNAEGIIIGYEETEETQVIDCSSPYWGRGFYQKDFGGEVLIDVAFDSWSGSGFGFNPAANGGSFNQPSTGIGGSFARFATLGDRLYTVDMWSLRTFDISTPSDPRTVGQPVQLGWQAETLFPFGDRLFIGTQSGLFIYETTTNPDQPTRLGEFQHARACDPVVSDGSTAYVTLHDGTACQGFANQLDVIDVKNITAPTMIRTYSMKRPMGLGVRQNLLFVCDDGLKIFDRTDPNAIDQNLVGRLEGFEFRDAIPVPWSNDLILTSPAGIFQFDASDPKNLKQRSLIAIEN